MSETYWVLERPGGRYSALATSAKQPHGTKILAIFTSFGEAIEMIRDLQAQDAEEKAMREPVR